MGPSNPSRTRVLPSWMKKVKSSKSTNVPGSSSTSLFPDSNETKELASTSRENLTHAGQVDRIFQKSTFVPRNTVLFVMSERELLETAKLILEEDEHSPSPVRQAENIEDITNEDDKDVMNENEQQYFANSPTTHVRLKSAKTKVNNFENSNNKTSNNCDHVNHNLKHHLKRRCDESDEKKTDDNKMDYEDAMDVEPSSFISTHTINGQFTSELFSLPNKNNKDSLPNQNMGTITSPSNLTPIPKKRLKPNFSILDEIFF